MAILQSEKLKNMKGRISLTAHGVLIVSEVRLQTVHAEKRQGKLLEQQQKERILKISLDNRF